MIWYRVGRKLGRTIYRCTNEDPDGQFIGIMDSAQEAQLVVKALNYAECRRHRKRSAAPGD